MLCTLDLCIVGSCESRLYAQEKDTFRDTSAAASWYQYQRIYGSNTLIVQSRPTVETVYRTPSKISYRLCDCSSSLSKYGCLTNRFLHGADLTHGFIPRFEHVIQIGRSGVAIFEVHQDFGAVNAHGHVARLWQVWLASIRHGNYRERIIATRTIASWRKIDHACFPKFSPFAFAKNSRIACKVSSRFPFEI